MSESSESSEASEKSEKSEAGEPMALFESIRGEIRRINPRVAVTASTTLEEDLRRNAYARPRFNVVVLGIR